MLLRLVYAREIIFENSLIKSYCIKKICFNFLIIAYVASTIVIIFAYITYNSTVKSNKVLIIMRLKGLNFKEKTQETFFPNGYKTEDK